MKTIAEIDPDEGVNKHHIPSCFFEKGEYEVWAAKTWNGGAPIVRIADNLCLATAKRYNWPRMEIRLHGQVVK